MSAPSLEELDRRLRNLEQEASKLEGQDQQLAAELKSVQDEIVAKGYKDAKSFKEAIEKAQAESERLRQEMDEKLRPIEAAMASFRRGGS